MGTNYYARSDDLPVDVHIGKYSAGWDFLFRAYPDRGVRDCEAWHALLSRPGVTIISEYGTTESLDDFWADAIRRPADVGGPHVMRCHADDRSWRDFSSDKQWMDKHGHPFSNYEFC